MDGALEGAIILRVSSHSRRNDFIIPKASKLPRQCSLENMSIASPAVE